VNRFLLYLTRWQASTLVMLGPMWLFNERLGLAGWIALPIVQCIGALVFWYPDRWIFAD